MFKPLIKRHAASTAYAANAPFRILLEYEGWTDSGNASQKWWELSYDGTPGGKVECNHGRLGHKGRKVPFKYDLWKALDKVVEKLSKGYDYNRSTSDAVPMGPVTPPPKAVSKLPPPFDTVASVFRARDMETGSYVWRAVDGKGVLVAELNESGAAKLKALMVAA